MKLNDLPPAVRARVTRALAKDAPTKPRKAKAIVPTEHQEQVRLFSIIDTLKSRYPDLECIAACPNGLRTSMRTAVKAKAEGLRSGYPDIIVDVPKYWDVNDNSDEVPNVQYFGLRVEMKRVKGGHVDPEQVKWHDRLRAQGYRVEVCKGCDEAWNVITEYLGIKT